MKKKMNELNKKKYIFTLIKLKHSRIEMDRDGGGGEIYLMMSNYIEATKSALKMAE